MGVCAIGAENPRTAIVLEIGRQNFFDDAAAKLFGLDRKHYFDAAIEISRHPVGAAQEHLLLASFAEDQDTAVFEETVDDAADADIFGEPWRAPVARQQMPRITRSIGTPALAGAIEGFNRGAIDQGIELGEDARFFAKASSFRLLVDELNCATAEVGRGDHQLLPLVFL